MSVTLPPELASLLNESGERWPQADEDRLSDLAACWRDASTELTRSRDQADAIAQTVTSEHRGASIDAFRAQWDKVDSHLAMGVAATEQVATLLDSMARATLTTKSAIVEVLGQGHAKRAEIQQAGGPVAVIGPLIGQLVRLLARFIGPLIRRLVNVVVNALKPAFRVIGRFFQDIIEFFGELFVPDPRPLPPPPPSQHEPVYRRDQPLPHARELIQAGEEWTGTGRKGGQLPTTAEPNSVLYRKDPSTGNYTGYCVYDERGFAIKRVDLEGRAHGGVPTPHVVDYKINTNPRTGEDFLGKVQNKEPRKAAPEEIP